VGTDGKISGAYKSGTICTTRPWANPPLDPVVCHPSRTPPGERQSVGEIGETMGEIHPVIAIHLDLRGASYSKW
jgi:hypothetical protein